MCKNERSPITENVLTYARGKIPVGFADIASTKACTQKPIYHTRTEPRRDRIFHTNVPVNSKTAHAPPGQTPGHLTFLKNFGQISRYVGSLDGQMPHPLELQRGSNPPPSVHVAKNFSMSKTVYSNVHIL